MPESTVWWDVITLTEDAWVEHPAASTVQDAVVRSQSGRIVQNTLTDNGVAETSTYAFDAAGRLATAVIPRHTLTYGYGTAGCGVAAAGKNNNRTSYSDTYDAGTPTTVAYCYDTADRLTATTVTAAPSGAGPVASGNLTTTGPGASLGYDPHGNTAALADQTLGYDVADQHISTTLADGTAITYMRDARGDIVQRVSTKAGTPMQTTRFSSGLVLDGSSHLVQASVSLPGGATVIVPVLVGAWVFKSPHALVVSTALGNISAATTGISVVLDCLAYGIAESGCQQKMQRFTYATTLTFATGDLAAGPIFGVGWSLYDSAVPVR